MLARYKLVASSDQASEHGPLPPSTHRRLYPTIALVLLTVANVCVLGLSIAIWRTAGVAATVTPEVSSTPTPTSLALPNALDPFHWNTPWGAPNASDADPLWDNINTAHGHIAVDHEFAAENHVSYPEPVLGKDDSVGQRVGVNSCNSGLPLWTYLECLVKGCIFSKPTISFTASYVTLLSSNTFTSIYTTF